MVLLSRSRKEGRESRIPTAEKHLQGRPGAAKAEGGVSPGGSGGSRIDPIIPAERARGEGQGEEEEEEEDEEYEDFSDLPDTRSITSDDSFYPPQETDEDESELSDSEQQLSLFRACCTNNAAVVRALIRQGPQEEDVRETDRNKRVRAQPGLGEGGRDENGCDAQESSLTPIH
ncbi:ankyrin repeat domain-containing protein 33B [Crotalus adamanteus]|uniref:Ankyrin repeat domain-containing protein 33B n=1 Tax=Crotalus adamanteus TaxID=8729 RepID=A0AAW1BNI1_CROAD